MADGSVGVAEPRKTEPVAASTLQQPAQRRQDATEGTGAVKAADAKGGDSLREMIDKLARAQEMVARVDPALAATIRGIAEKVDAPESAQLPMYRTKVAYALQDVERLVGPVRSVPQGLREEMTRLAATSPGLQNERMQDLVRSTPILDDRGLIRDIRRDAAEIARSSNQTSPDIQGKVDVLENRARLSRVGEVAAGVVAELQTAANAPQPSPQPAAAAKLAEKGNEPLPKPYEAPMQVTAGQQQPTLEQPRQVRAAGATFAIMAALRKPEPVTPAPWDQQLTPLKGRVARYLETAQANQEEASLRAAEQSGQAAVQALRAFAAGPGASIMGKIQAAGKADPDGMPGVIAGMREGGPYADLRQTFNAGLQREKGLASALDQASAAVSKYGADRTVADSITMGRADAATITARFAKLDAEVGRSASETPGRKDGKSQMEELGERAAELARKAVEAVKAAFQRIPGAEHRPSAGSSPS